MRIFRTLAFICALVPLGVRPIGLLELGPRFEYFGYRFCGLDCPANSACDCAAAAAGTRLSRLPWNFAVAIW